MVSLVVCVSAPPVVSDRLPVVFTPLVEPMVPMARPLESVRVIVLVEPTRVVIALLPFVRV